MHDVCSHHGEYFCQSLIMPNIPFARKAEPITVRIVLQVIIHFFDSGCIFNSHPNVIDTRNS